MSIKLKKNLIKKKEEKKVDKENNYEMIYYNKKINNNGYMFSKMINLYNDYVKNNNPLSEWNIDNTEIKIDSINNKVNYYYDNNKKGCNCCFILCVMDITQNLFLSINDIYGIGLNYCLGLLENLKYNYDKKNEMNVDYIWKIDDENVLNNKIRNDIIYRAINKKFGALCMLNFVFLYIYFNTKI